jgi:hypothetical protein
MLASEYAVRSQDTNTSVLLVGSVSALVGILLITHGCNTTQ